jgi:hypothetical protein
MYSPRWLFLIPGLALVLLGFLLFGGGLLGVSIVPGVVLGLHTVLFGSLSVLCGTQSIVFALVAKTFAVNESLMPADKRLDWFLGIVNLERGIVISVALLLIGLILLGFSIYEWKSAGFGVLEYSHTMRYVITGSTLVALGFQLLLSNFMISILGMKRK